jgi:hypothetical protein
VDPKFRANFATQKQAGYRTICRKAAKSFGAALLGKLGLGKQQAVRGQKAVADPWSAQVQETTSVLIKAIAILFINYLKDIYM